MDGDKNDMASLTNGFMDGGRQFRLVFPYTFPHEMQRIHNCIPGHDDTIRCDMFGKKILGRPSGRSKMQGRGQTGYPPVKFFRKGFSQIPTAQACFHMAYRNTAVKRTGCRNHDRCRITLNQ